jgi:cysteine desulfurase
MIYLDNAATTPVRTEALQAAWPFLTNEFGNPSSTHELGGRASTALDGARERVAHWFGARGSEIIFTSGGTESDNLGIIGLALANSRGKHVISARSEHEAVIAAVEFLERVHGFEVTWLELDELGSIRGGVAGLRAALRSDTTLVTLMVGNNEIGTLHPIAELAAATHEVGALFHTDAVQAVGWVDLNVKNLGVDALSISGHKFGAPKGSGALYLKSRTKAEPIIHGGGQENELRSGTENVAWAVALATALELLPEVEAEARRVAAIRDAFILQVMEAAPNALPTGHPTGRLASIASFCFVGVSGESILVKLEERGIICSSGSACAAGSDEPSHVLLAIGVEREVAQSAVRFSLAHDTTEEELESAVIAISESLASIQGLR